MDYLTADAFHVARGNEAWEGSPSEKSAAIVRAQDYIEAFYELRDGTETHPLREKATALLALEFLERGPALKRDREIVKFKENTADVITEETQYGDTPSDPYPMITAILRPIFAGSAGGFTMMRLVR